LLTVPHVALPHFGAVHATQVPAWHVVVPVQSGHTMDPLPHALAMLPQWGPASVAAHSGATGPQTPPVHCWPVGQPGQFRVLPQESVIVPHNMVPLFGVQVSAPHAGLPASLGPASLLVIGMHRLFTQLCPVGHPPQPMATPHESVPMTPHLPVQEGVWQLWEVPFPVHTWPLGHGDPHAIVVPHGSV
jgi:hypothetical protein